MAMADGYAMASGKLGVVNVHICAGLGNAMGMLYNAFREGTPLLLTAGQQDRRLRFEEPILWGDMLGVVRPWTKWAVEVERVEDLPVGPAAGDANCADAADRARVHVAAAGRANGRGGAEPRAVRSARSRVSAGSGRGRARGRSAAVGGRSSGDSWSAAA